jgi:hypothetical protein
MRASRASRRSMRASLMSRQPNNRFTKAMAAPNNAPSAVIALTTNSQPCHRLRSKFRASASSSRCCAAYLAVSAIARSILVTCSCSALYSPSVRFSSLPPGNAAVVKPPQSIWFQRRRPACRPRRRLVRGCRRAAEGALFLSRGRPRDAGVGQHPPGLCHLLPVDRKVLHARVLHRPRARHNQSSGNASYAASIAEGEAEAAPSFKAALELATGKLESRPV